MFLIGAALLSAALGCSGIRPDAGTPQPDMVVELPSSCIRLLREALPDLRQTDSLLVMGQMGVAVERYRSLVDLYPDCAPLHSRLADASALLGRASQAIEHYESALALDPCDGSARAGIAALGFPTDPRSAARANELRRILLVGQPSPAPDAPPLTCPTTPATAGLAWRLALVAGDTTAARAVREGLIRTAPYPPSLLQYGRNLIADAAPGAILLTGSRLETDVALASAVATARGVSVVDLSLLDQPNYARQLQVEGLDFGLSDDALLAMAPHWSPELGRRVSVAESLVRRLLKGDRPVAVSGTVDHPLLIELQDRLVVVGLVQRVVRERGGVSPSSVEQATIRWRVGGLEAASLTPSPVESVREARRARRLLWRYAEVAVSGAQAALRRGDRETGARLLTYARARTAELGASDALLARLVELEAVAEIEAR
jgi:tetratricopeptide (TPR) repeat protein